MNIQGPESLMQMMQGVQVSGIFKAAVELEVYTKIAGGAATVPAIAKATGCPERSTGILLDALAALTLVTKEADTYRLVPITEQFLVKGKPTYMGDLAQLFCSSMMWNAANSLTDAVKNGGTVLAEHAETPRHTFWEMFARSTSAIAVPAAMALDGLVGEWLAGRSTVRVLDIAAGSGLYGFTLAKHPNVQLTTLDWPNVLVETKQWAKRMEVDASRVRYIEGNLFDVDYQGPYDLVLLSHVYHHFDSPTCEALTKKAAAAVAPGGRVVVHDFINEASLANPMAALFSVSMLLWTRKGQAYGATDYNRWFEAAGLKPAGVHASAGMPSSFLLADK